MDTHRTWYLVGDASRARIFARGTADKHLNLLHEFEHPESRMSNQELVSDRPGRTQQSSAASRGNPAGSANLGHRSAMEPHTSPKTVEQEHFAHELAAALYKGLMGQEYEELVLVAGPQFLGLLRSVLDEQVQKHVTVSLDRDYTYFTSPELEKHLAAQLGRFPAS